jgi:flagellar M-ring protein FliF
MATATQLEKSPTSIPVEPAGWQSRIKGLLGIARVRWAGLPPQKRALTVSAAALLAIATGFLLWYTLRTDWRTLYSGMDPDDARATGQALVQAAIPFEPTPDGTGIRVPANQLDKARMITASKGSAKTGRLGFELFDKPNWVGSEFDEQVNFQRALEGELEHTIGTLADVASARVHLVMAHDSLFRDSERPAKASVVLKLRHRNLADGEPEAIRNLVASAVDSLSPERVVLVDAAGNQPLGPKTADALRQTAEQTLEEKLVATLEPVTGSGNVRASVTVDYEQAATDTVQESYDPDKTVTLSMQRSEQTTSAQQVAAGVPGTASNAPNSQSVPVYPQQTTPPQAARTESGTYGASKTERHVVEQPGRVHRLTAAIIVNDRLLSAASNSKGAIYQPRSPDEIRTLTALAQAAVGFDPTRGDMVTVQDLAFDDNRLQQPVPSYRQLLDVAEGSPVVVRYLALVLGLLVIMVFGLVPMVYRLTHVPKPQKINEKAKVKGKDAKGVAAAMIEKGAAEQAAFENSEAYQAALRPPESPEAELERTRAQEIFDQVAAQLKLDPGQSSRLLQSWIHSD